MKSTILLRIASVLSFIHAALHTAGGMFGGPKSAEQVAAREAVQSHRFVIFGVNRSYWDFYFGFGLVACITLLLLSVLLWQLASLAKTNPNKARPFVATLLVAFVAMAVISKVYFFAPPFVMEIVITILIAVAFFFLQKEVISA